jgi:hypothetical protein
MFENLHLTFEVYDYLLIFAVTALGTFSAYLRDPQLKAVTATIPVPFGFAYIAIGLPIGAANAGGALLCLLYVHVVRILTYKAHLPIILSIIAGIATFVILGALLLPLTPPGESFFLLICAVNFLLGIILFQTQTYRPGKHHKTHLPLYIKAPAIAGVVTGLMIIKKIIGGFATSFPMMNSIVSYESRYSLGDQCRQLPLFLIAAPFMWISMRYAEIFAKLNHWWVLAIGVTIYMIFFWPLNQELKRRILVTAGKSL